MLSIRYRVDWLPLWEELRDVLRERLEDQALLAASCERLAISGDRLGRVRFRDRDDIEAYRDACTRLAWRRQARFATQNVLWTARLLRRCLKRIANATDPAARAFGGHHDDVRLPPSAAVNFARAMFHAFFFGDRGQR